MNNKQLTSCFLTGRSSSFVAASSIEGLEKETHKSPESNAVQESRGCGVMEVEEVGGRRIAHHSSEDEESVKVGVGLLLRFLVLPSSTEATASLSALRLAYEVDATGGGGDIELPFGFLLCNVLSIARSFSSCSRRMLSKKSPRRTR